MRRDLSMLVVILLLSSGAAVAANLGWHGLAWIRTAPPPAAGATTKPGGPTVDQVLEHVRNQTAWFVDAREEDEYLLGRLRGAVFLPSSAVYENIENIMAMVGLDEKIIVYCGGGECEASHVVADVLREFDFTDVEIYVKGWDEIESSGKFTEYIMTGEEY